MKHHKKFIKTTLSAAIMLALPITGLAEVEKIVVTAQKRSEPLQDVPVAITAFTGATMEALGITDASDLVAVTPGLTSSAQGGSNRNYFLRGIGTGDFHLTASPAVGQYYDGITLTSGFQARAALFDMQRVEVLKGPQNTLFGLNTTGGAINYITNKPEIDGGTNGSVKVKIGSDSLINTESAIGFDISDSVAARLAVMTNKNDGPFTSLSDGRDYGDDDMKAVRLGVLWAPVDDASLLFNVNTMQSENNSTASELLGSRAPDGSGDVCAEFNRGNLDFERNTDCVGRDGGATGEQPTDPSTGSWDTISTNFGLEDIKTKGYYLAFDYDFDIGTLSLISSFDNLDFKVATDVDGSATLGAHLTQEDDRDTYQHELRFVSDGLDAFRWIAGIYYLDQDAESFTGIRSPGIGGGNIIPNVQLAHSKENLGIYTQAEYDLTDDITITSGLRWSDEKIVADYLPSSPNAQTFDNKIPLFSNDIDELVRLQNNVENPNLDVDGYDIRRQVRQNLSNEDIGYTVKLDWKATEDALLYASLSKGFKGGAADIRTAYALVPPANILTGLEDARLEPESLKAWEVGYKSSFLKNSIQLDAAVFYYTYFNKQQFVTAGGIPTLANAPQSEIKGLDANVKYANDYGLFLDFGLALIDSEITDAGEDELFIEGTELGNTPKYSLSMVAKQEIEFQNGTLLTLMGNVNYTDDETKGSITRGSSELKDLITQEAFTLVNMNVKYSFGDDLQYAVSLYGNNLTDEHFCASLGTSDGNKIYADGISPGSLGYNVRCVVTRASTRTFGLSFGLTF
ncbi:TonB-dependent receptor, plug [Paraglaciecola sp. T6c]|uniref:TonB-dependent receptor n=1 Tax=Pseudoalteromonas atlantica (strain T6c / ATCC BAA-1087) TaxID=3042615 RepID=UPI00005C6891|nr:TonB-dependent receptor [Paraglaciecola sp. T6c]ABG42401.1 TonB-dependent receptor, plug [Paraglaciecola sp. T6c]